ncbi:hypothetical protein [Mariniflexile sp. HMF6888]|uniref:hypothetical protein n=1 Tax=Mariniflexile sp. HMF6888 TaxID=3373086 RepID=UPI00378BE6D1
MKTNKDIQHKIEDTFEVLKTVQEVKVSPFFKDRTMQVLFAEKEAEQNKLPWFSPKLQLATLVCIILLNVYAFAKIKTAIYEEKVSDFASAYGLSLDSETNLFN